MLSGRLRPVRLAACLVRFTVRFVSVLVQEDLEILQDPCAPTTLVGAREGGA